MLIHEVCNLCGLTKKAVEYYEQQGFIQPQVLDNGYRNYDAKQADTLKEIAVLRRCGLAITDIRTVLSSTNKPLALARYKHLNELRIKRLNATQTCIDSLIEYYDIEKGFLQLGQMDVSPVSIRERLVLAFPGSFGLFLSFHFGRFLDEPIQTTEQRAAYDKVVAYLDSVASYISEELGVYLEQAIPLYQDDAIRQYEGDLNRLMEQAIADPDALFRSMNIEQYIAYRTSEAFKQSPAGQLSDLLIAFQKSSGYADVFLKNLKLLSPAYRQYCDSLERVNRIITEQYPALGQLYDTSGSQGNAQSR